MLGARTAGGVRFAGCFDAALVGRFEGRGVLRVLRRSRRFGRGAESAGGEDGRTGGADLRGARAAVEVGGRFGVVFFCSCSRFVGRVALGLVAFEGRLRLVGIEDSTKDPRSDPDTEALHRRVVRSCRSSCRSDRRYLFVRLGRWPAVCLSALIFARSAIIRWPVVRSTYSHRAAFAQGSGLGSLSETIPSSPFTQSRGTSQCAQRARIFTPTRGRHWARPRCRPDRRRAAARPAEHRSPAWSPTSGACRPWTWDQLRGSRSRADRCRC